MTLITQQIMYEIDWRTSEIATIKTTPFLYPLSIRQKEVLRQYVIPNVYALWEGYVVEVFGIYAREINNLKLSRHDISISILTHSIDSKYGLRSARTDFDKQMMLVSELCAHLDKEVELPTLIPTESNVNYKVINGILRRFNLKLLPAVPFEKRLQRLLFFRNKLAHGERTVPVTQELIDEASYTVISAMHAVGENIVEGYQNKTYLS